MLEKIPCMIHKYNGSLCLVKELVEKLWTWKILFVRLNLGLPNLVLIWQFLICS